MEPIEKWLALCPAATDIHLTEGEEISVREYGELKILEEKAEQSVFKYIFHTLILPNERKAYEEKGAWDASFSVGENRFRLHLYRSGGKNCAALRVLPALSGVDKDPDEAWFEEIAKLSSGLVLFSGPAGSGKSTAMARALERIGAEKARHIVTLEDPVEYILTGGFSLIHQREVGRDTASFAEGVRESLREDPDVIAVGELRDRETIAAALTAAETGHLVLGTLHNACAIEAVGRMIHVFPAEEQSEVRLMIASVLCFVSAQRLWRRGKKTVLLREILTNTPAVASLIREGKEAQIRSYMETGIKQMRTLRQAAYRVKGVTEEERKELLHLAGE